MYNDDSANFTIENNSDLKNGKPNQLKLATTTPIPNILSSLIKIAKSLKYAASYNGNDLWFNKQFYNHLRLHCSNHIAGL